MKYKQVDVFSTLPYRGNPVAVVLDADTIGDSEMQRIAAWLGVAETTFVLKPTNPNADYRLRIFNPVYELPFAGHPTLGSAHAVLEHGLKPKTPGSLVQECKVGLVDLHIDHRSERTHRVSLTMPPATFTPASQETVDALQRILGMTSKGPWFLIDVGPKWLTASFDGHESLLAMSPDMKALASLSKAVGAVGVTAFAPRTDGSAAYEVRSFTPASGVDEDPVCGSGNGCVAAYLRHRTGAPQTYIARQGTAIRRDGYIYVRSNDEGDILLSGDAVTCVEGSIYVA